MSVSMERQLENQILAAKHRYDHLLTVRRATLTKSQQAETWHTFIRDIAPTVHALMRLRDELRTGRRVLYD